MDIPELVDVYWENLVLGFIGETIEENDEICGCRVVDKFKVKGKNSAGNPNYRLEIWFKTNTSPELAERVRIRMLETLADGDIETLATLPTFKYTVRNT